MTQTLEILDRLISFDTVSVNPNADIIAYIEDFLVARGARCQRLPSKLDGKFGLYAEIGPHSGGGVVLSAHTDVVPTTGQNWTRTPFKLTRDGDRLFGRGTTDMKGYVACMMQAADIASKTSLSEPLKLVFSYDEEIGCVGIQEMMDRLPDLIGTPRSCFVGEPTEMQAAIGHKGKSGMTAVCTGQAGHSALAPNFVNALYLATDFVSGLRDVQSWLVANGARDAAYDIPYSTVHVGKMSGGTALNIVPDTANITFEFRHLAADVPQNIMQKITDMAAGIEAQYQKTFAGAAIKITQFNTYPGLDVSASSTAAILAKRLLETSDTTKVAFGTEAGFFESLGISTVVCGPGSMAGQGHKADEYIDLSQLVACEKMLVGIVQDLSNPAH